MLEVMKLILQATLQKTREQIMREYNELNTMVPTDDSIPEGTGITADDDWKDWEPKTVETQSTSIQTQSYPIYRSP